MFCMVVKEHELPPDRKCSVCGMVLAPIAAAPMIDEQERAMIGLETEAIRERPLVREVRLFGEVDYDDTRVVAVSARADGWLERVDAKTTWVDVEAGDTLFALYSPALLEAQQEFLIARDAGEGLRRIAAERLALLGLEAREIDAIEKAGETQRVVAYRAPIGGTIIRRHAVQGAAVKAGQEIYAIADLSQVWLQLEAFESDLPLLRPGAVVRITPDLHGPTSTPGLERRITFIDPVVDPRSRTVRLRVEMDNPRVEGRYTFLPGERVVGVARIALGPEGAAPRPMLAVPHSSVLRTGVRTVVYVLHGVSDDGSPVYDLDPKRLPTRLGYELVEVELGPLARRADAETRELYYGVLRVVPPPDDNPLRLRRLHEGHLVARHGALLLDSQAQLAGRPSLRFPAGRATAAGADAHANH